jgi:hypothetical protein
MYLALLLEKSGKGGERKEMRFWREDPDMREWEISY